MHDLFRDSQRKGMAVPVSAVIPGMIPEMFSALMEMAAESGLPVVGTRTRILIGEDGTTRYLRSGTEAKTVLLGNLPGADRDLLDAVHSFQELMDKIEMKEGEAAKLEEEAHRLGSELVGRRTDLRFEISEALPDNHHDLYGSTSLELVDEEGRLILTDTGDTDDGFTLSEEVGRPLYEMQEAIEEDVRRVQEMRNHARKLRRETTTLPDLLERKQIAVGELLQSKIGENLDSDPEVLTWSAGFNEEGDAVVVLTRPIREETDTIPEKQLNFIRAAMELDGNTDSLPAPVKKALGFSTPPPIEDKSTSEVKTEQPAGTADSQS